MYAEEALQSEPANKRWRANVMEPREKSKKDAPSGSCRKSNGGNNNKFEPAGGSKASHDKGPVANSPLWVAANGYRGRDKTWRKVAVAGWNMPMSQWSTACGWCFADRSANVSLAHKLTLVAKKCKKCIDAKGACDSVKGGANLAGLVGSDLVQCLR